MVARRNVPRLVAEFVRHDGAVGAVAVCDAGLVRTSPDESGVVSGRRAGGMARSVSLGEPLLKDFVRLLKLGMGMFGAEGVPELRLHKVRLPHEQPSPKAIEMIESSRARLDLRLSLEDKGSGRLQLYFDVDDDEGRGFPF
jgi:hypothetical protein